MNISFFCSLILGYIRCKHLPGSLSWVFSASSKDSRRLAISKQAAICAALLSLIPWTFINCERLICESCLILYSFKIRWERFMTFSCFEPVLRIIARSSESLNADGPFLISLSRGLSSFCISRILILYSCIGPYNYFHMHKIFLKSPGQ